MSRRGEPTSLREMRHGSEPVRVGRGPSSGDRREHAALRRVGLWGVVLGTLAVLLLGALGGAFSGGT